MNLRTGFDPKLDLMIERVIDVPRARAWDAWTQPELLKEWFCPKPWGVSHCVIDLRPGGVFHTVMRSPTGDEFPGEGCYLEIVPRERLVWTSVLLPGYRPAPPGELPFTGVITLADHPEGTHYVAQALHGDEASCTKHREMGFEVGWNKALDQLVQLVKSLPNT